MGFNNEDISGASKETVGASSFLDSGTIPVISEKSSSNTSASTTAGFSGIPSTKSSESFLSSTSLGIGNFIGCSPRALLRVISSPRERISLLNFFS